jgi:two-component system, chemotaxis family, protein-glutamate methylesterase/glutaminase
VPEPPIGQSTPPDLLAVVGASAGGLAALQRMLGQLPSTFSDAVCIVMHLAPKRPSYLGRILARATEVPVTTARDGDPLEPGHVYVAPPDYHLVVSDHRLRLVVGPNENGHRPAVDTAFRSAAHAFGPAVVGVVLSGSLDDGAAGLREIKARGGRALVQHPNDADYDGMPLAALEAIHPDLLASAEEIGRWLAAAPALATETKGWHPGAAPVPITSPQPMLTCPDCHGPLQEVTDGDLLRFDCLIGHRWSTASLSAFQRTDVENSLWAGLRALEEQAALNRRLAERSHRVHRDRAAAAFATAAAEADQQAAVLRDIIKTTVVEAADLQEDTG